MSEVVFRLIHQQDTYHSIVWNPAILSSSPREKRGSPLDLRETVLVCVLYEPHLRKSLFTPFTIFTVLGIPARGVGKQDPSLRPQPPQSLHSSTQEWLCWVPEGSWADGKLFLLYCTELSENLQELMFFFLPRIQDLDFLSLPVDAEGCELCFLEA